MSRSVEAATFALAAVVTLSSAQGAPKPYEPARARVDRTAEADATLRDFLARFRTAVAKGDIGFVDSVLSPRFAVLTCTDSPLDPCAPGKPTARSAGGASPAERLRAGLGAAPAPAAVETDEDMEADEEADLAEEETAEAPAGGQAPASGSAGTAASPATDTAPTGPAPTGAAPPAPAKPAPKPRTVEDVVIGQLSGLVERAFLGAHPDLPGLVCLPAWPLFDRTAARRIVTATGIREADLRLASNETQLRAAPKIESEPVATLAPGTIVAQIADAATPPGWTALALPDARILYTDDLGLDELSPTGPCFSKETGAWTLALVVLRDR